jgi:hypothetical protein
MMQPYASTAKLRGGGPNLRTGFEARGECGSPPPRIVIGRQSVNGLPKPLYVDRSTGTFRLPHAA